VTVTCGEICAEHEGRTVEDRRRLRASSKADSPRLENAFSSRGARSPLARRAVVATPLAPLFGSASALMTDNGSAMKAGETLGALGSRHVARARRPRRR